MVSVKKTMGKQRIRLNPSQEFTELIPLFKQNSLESTFLNGLSMHCLYYQISSGVFGVPYFLCYVITSNCYFVREVHDLISSSPSQHYHPSTPPTASHGNILNEQLYLLSNYNMSNPVSENPYNYAKIGAIFTQWKIKLQLISLGNFNKIQVVTTI